MSYKPLSTNEYHAQKTDTFLQIGGEFVEANISRLRNTMEQQMLDAQQPLTDGYVELLEALEDAVHLLEHFAPDEVKQCHLDAIAKAKGGTT